MSIAPSHRYLELDLLRSLAVILMIIYHAAYDLQFYYNWNLGLFENPLWTAIELGTAGVFLLLVGCSFAISWNRHQVNTPDPVRWTLYRKYLKRGLLVIACGMLVSAVTYAVDPETYVRFGVLHLIGVSILLLPFFAWMKEWNVLIGLGFGFLPSLLLELRPAGGLGLLPMSMFPQTNLFLPLGIHAADFASVDYFPLFPWFGIVLIGYAIGYFVYVRKHWVLLSRTHEGALLRTATWPGRNALLIYLVHQPLVLGFLGVLGILKIL